MVAARDLWEGHELLNELEPGMVRTFLARQVGDTRSLVWIHMREGSRVERADFCDEIRRLQRIAARVPHLDPVLYGGVRDAVAWVATTVHANAIRLKEAARGANLGLTAMEIAIELGGYLVQGNNRGWVHGSMNPEHVLIGSGGGYLITHFGFVRLFEPGQEEAEREPRYAAPELLQGKSAPGKRTDVYGLGTVLYELLCRRELYGNERHLVYCALNREPEYPVAVPAVLRRVIAKALSKNPHDRYPSAEHLLEVLRAHAGDWDHLEQATDVVEQPPEMLSSSSDVAAEAPIIPPPSSPTSETTAPINALPTNDGEASSSALDLGTLAPPSPRVYAADPIPITTAGLSASEPTRSPGAVTGADRQDRDPWRRSRAAVLVVALGSLATVVGMAILGSERLERPVARLAPAVRSAAAALRVDPAVAPRGSPAATPVIASEVIAPEVFATRRAAFVRRSVETQPPAMLAKQCKGPYACGTAKQY